VKELYGGRRQAEAFVDEVERAGRAKGTALDDLLERQWTELTTLARLALGDAVPR